MIPELLPALASYRSMLSRLTVVTVVAIVLPVGPQAVRLIAGQSSDNPVQWLTGRDLDRNNQLAISVSWTDAPLRSRLSAFAKQQKVGIFLDRRVDPSQLISISISQGTPEQFLWEVADKCGLGICRIENFYYLGPPKTAAVLPHVWNPMKKISSKLRRTSTIKWTDRAPLQIDSVVEPRKLLDRLAEEYEFTITNANNVPHDVWSGFELPSMSLDGRIAILLVGFDQWFERSADGRELTFVDFPDLATGQMEIKDLVDSKQTSSEMKAKFPDLKISTSRTAIKATGDPIQLAKMRRVLVKAQEPIVDDKSLAPLTLATKASRKAILMKVAEVTGKKFTFASDALKELNEQVTVNVENASVHKLVKEVLKGSDLKFEINDTQLRISK